jgi:K+-sensing histidine kinase KdpD
MFNRTQNITASRAKELSDRMISSIERSDRLLRNLLDSTKAAVGETPHLTLKKAKLYDVLETARTCVTHDPELIQVTCPYDIIGFCDPDAIIRITENLLSNAIKYGDSNSVITIKAQLLTENKVSISVHNWGDPIPEEDRESIFTLFKRNSLAEHPPVWGIGLSAVKILTSALGGQVNVSSCSRLGTTFTFVLPLDSRNSSLENRA